MISLRNHVKSKKAPASVFSVVFLCGVIISFAMYWEESEHAYIDQKALGTHFTEKLNNTLTQYKSEFSAVVALIESSKGEVTSEHFARFARNLVSTHEMSLYSAQYVPLSKKNEYEIKQRILLGNSDFTIHPEGDRAEYLPLTLGYPDKLVYGYDLLYPDYKYVASIQAVRNASDVVLSQPSLSPFAEDAENSFLDTFIFRAPIYLSVDVRPSKITDSIGFHGMVGAYFNVDDLLNQIAPLVNKTLFYRMGDITEGPPIWFADSSNNAWKEGEYNSSTIAIAGRKWRVDTRYIESIQSQLHWWLILMPVLLFTVLGLCLAFYTRKLALTYFAMLDTVNKRIEIDELTGLFSRYQIQHRLSELIVGCKKTDKKLAAMILDLDHFKTINDAFGHGVGDKLLVKVSERLTSVLPENAEVGYLGGDAFLVILVQSDHQEMPQLNTLSKDIIHKISQSYFVDGLTLDIGCSIGVALFPDFGLDAVTLIKNADMAVYQAKTAGRATYHFYDGDMGQRFARNVRIETRLRQGLLNEKLELHFQPKVDLMSERCVGMEALLRWEDEELGVVSPAEFVPIAERSGIILPLGDWVFEQAFRHIIEWQEQGITVPPIAINCSAAQLKRVDFLPKLMALLDKYKVDPSLLEIEVTESILIEDAESCAELLRQISRLGMKLAIDDFGTGYSSLSYLKNFPFHYVKIDQVFIRDIIEDDNNAALTKAIISLSHSLGLKVIAEGIDSNEQLALLREYGCDIGQGYLFSKALGARSMGSDPIMVALNEQEQHL